MSRLMHGNSALYANPRSITQTDYQSFHISIHVVAALLIAAPAALIAQFMAHRRVAKNRASTA